MTIRVTGTGSALPEKIVTNFELQKLVETSDEWIRERTGIAERRISTGETVSSLSAEACIKALEMAGRQPEEVDLILVATCSPELLLPCCACQVQDRIGAVKAVAFDVNAACSGFLFALNTAYAYLQTGIYQNALIVGSEVLSKLVDWTDRGTCVLFGDGAGAIIMSESSDGNDDILALNINADGTMGRHITMNLVGDNCPLVEPAGLGQQKITMNGKEVYKFVVQTMPESIMHCLKDASLEPKDIDYLVPHQANLRIIEGLQSRLEFDDEKVIVNIDKYGNTSAASVPIALAEALESGKIKTPSKAILCAFGAGMAWGSAVVRLRENLK